MKNNCLKALLLCLLIAFTACKVTAQRKFKTHAVKEGETLQSIAKRYGVTPYSILLANKDVKKATDIKPNTFLIIDLSNSTIKPGPITPPASTGTVERDTVKPGPSDSNPLRFTAHRVISKETIFSLTQQYDITEAQLRQYNPELNSRGLQTGMVLQIPRYPKVVETKATTEQPERIAPLRFMSHKVRRKETIFSITQLYGIKEAQLKRYNKSLYSEALKKGMILQIPRYPTEEQIVKMGLNFDTITVQPKETRWSIAHRFGISLDSLAALNPDLPKNSSYLSVGQQLKVPVLVKEMMEETTPLYESYTVPTQMTLYSLSKLYEIEQKEILRLNPVIVQEGGLKEGMVLRFPKKEAPELELTTENYVYYPVSAKQNIFRITQELGVSRDTLFALNPELEAGLKEGMILKLPKERAQNLNVKEGLVLNQINLIDSLDVNVRPQLVYLLPFRLDRYDLADKEKAARQLKARTDSRYAMGLYTGAIVALDSIKSMGMSVDVKFWDTQRDLERVKNLLESDPLTNASAVVGPVDRKLLGEVAIQASKYNVPVITPFLADSELTLQNVYFSVPDEESLRVKMLDYLASKRTDENIIIMADEVHMAVRDSILSRFPEAKVADLVENTLDREAFAEMLSEEVENWVILETDMGSIVASITSILNAANTDKKKDVRMFTTHYDNAFEDKAISRPHLANLNFTFPSVFREVANDQFMESYRSRWGVEADRYAIRGFDLTFDLLLKLGYKNNLFQTTPFIGETEYSGNRFNYFKEVNNDCNSGYGNKASFILRYNYDLTISQVENE